MRPCPIRTQHRFSCAMPHRHEHRESLRCRPHRVAEAAKVMMAVTTFMVVVMTDNVLWASASMETHRVPQETAGRVPLRGVLSVLFAHFPQTEPLELGRKMVRVRGRSGERTLASWNQTFGACGVTFRQDRQDLLVQVHLKTVATQRARCTELVRRFALEHRSGKPPASKDTPVAQDTASRQVAHPRREGLSHAPHSNDTGPPVLLIHGLDSSSKTFNAAADALGAEGYNVYFFDYQANKGVPELGDELAGNLRTLHAQTGRKVSLIATSLGALIAQYAIEQSRAYGGEVTHFIACAPPFRGVTLARYRLSNALTSFLGGMVKSSLGGVLLFDQLGDAALDLEPGCPLLTRLAAGRRTADVQYTIIAGNGSILSEQALDALSGFLDQLRRNAKGVPNEMVQWVKGAIAEAKKVAGGRGDGIIPLTSTFLKGVTDRIVLPLHHLQFLSSPSKRRRRSTNTVHALAEVLSRLPKPTK
jgi:pimeloyl-ACP methyl ester carboxylesterase